MHPTGRPIGSWSIVCLLLVGCHADLGHSLEQPYTGTGIANHNVLYYSPGGVWVRAQPASAAVAVSRYSTGNILRPSAYSPPLARGPPFAANDRATSIGAYVDQPEAGSGSGSSAGCQCNRINATADKIASLMERLRQMLPFKQQLGISREDGSVNSTAPPTGLTTSTAAAAAAGTSASSANNNNNNNNANVNTYNSGLTSAGMLSVATEAGPSSTTVVVGGSSSTTTSTVAPSSGELSSSTATSTTPA